jgi:hypothetical protein
MTDGEEQLAGGVANAVSGVGTGRLRAGLMGRFHDASRTVDISGYISGSARGGYSWSAEMADPAGGTLLCHNDVCLENVVFRAGVAVGLLDSTSPRRGGPSTTSRGWRGAGSSYGGGSRPATRTS